MRQNKYVVRIIVEAVEVNERDDIVHHDGEVYGIDSDIVDGLEQAQAIAELWWSAAQDVEHPTERIKRREYFG